jgi:hypothetical protein
MYRPQEEKGNCIVIFVYQSPLTADVDLEYIVSENNLYFEIILKK